MSLSNKENKMEKKKALNVTKSLTKLNGQRVR